MATALFVYEILAASLELLMIAVMPLTPPAKFLAAVVYAAKTLMIVLLIVLAR
jgi:hypothetical protein